MSGSNSKQWMLSAALAAILISCSFSAFAGDDKRPTHKKTNINLAVASNFYGIPPNNSAITDLINEFQAENPRYTVTVTDNGATATLEANIINGNINNVDLFLAADTETPQDLLVNHFGLVTPYNNSLTPHIETVWGRGYILHEPWQRRPPRYTCRMREAGLSDSSHRPRVG